MTYQPLDKKTWDAYVAYYSRYPWQLFCTFTFTRRLRGGEDEARLLWGEFLNRLEAAHLDTICRLVAEESRHAHGQLAGVRLHYHALFASDTPIGESTIRDLWRQLVGNGKSLVEIRRYDPAEGAVGYCLKSLAVGGDISTFNDDLYAPDRPADWDRNADSRRRWRRQMERRARSESTGLILTQPAA
jgi:hypothetical protein